MFSTIYNWCGDREREKKKSKSFFIHPKNKICTNLVSILMLVKIKKMKMKTIYIVNERRKRIYYKN